MLCIKIYKIIMYNIFLYILMLLYLSPNSVRIYSEPYFPQPGIGSSL